MTAEGAGRGKLTQLMTNHVLGYINRYMPSAVVHCDGMTNHLGEDGAGPAPRADDLFIIPSVHYFNFFQELGLNERALFERS